MSSAAQMNRRFWAESVEAPACSIAAAHKQIGNTEKYQQEYGGPEIAMSSLWFIFRQYWFPLRQNSWNDVHHNE
jgi:hypothetical protein